MVEPARETDHKQSRHRAPHRLNQRGPAQPRSAPPSSRSDTSWPPHSTTRRPAPAFVTSGSPDGGWLPEAGAADLLSCYGVPLVATMTAATEQEATADAAHFGGRVVLKAEAEGLMHRTDAGAVKADLRTTREVAEGYRTLAASFGPRLQWVLVQPLLEGGVEVTTGMAQEPVFGPLVMFGSGGAAAEVHGDQVARLIPLTDADADAEEMIHAVHAAPLLAGGRDRLPADTAALADALLRVARLADDLPEVSELDLNPVIALQDGAWCVDVRVRISPAEPRGPFLRPLL